MGIYYRPQRSWGKVTFLHVSVILFTEGGLGLCPEGLCPRGSLSWGSPSRGVSVQGVPVIETPHTVMSRQYASYWNAFVFMKVTTENTAVSIVLV